MPVWGWVVVAVVIIAALKLVVFKILVDRKKNKSKRDMDV